MSVEMDEEIKRSKVLRKSALVLYIIQEKTAVSDSSRQFDLRPSVIESWIDQAKSEMENALKARPADIRQQYVSELKALQESYGEAMLELRARQKWDALVGRKDETCVMTHRFLHRSGR
jgi:hypothetical protein